MAYPRDDSQKVINWRIAWNRARNNCNFVRSWRYIKLNLIFPILLHSLWLVRFLMLLSFLLLLFNLFNLFNFYSFHSFTHFFDERFLGRRLNNCLCAWPKERNGCSDWRQKRSQDVLLSLVILLDFGKIFDVISDPFNVFVLIELLGIQLLNVMGVLCEEKVSDGNIPYNIVFAAYKLLEPL